MRKYLIATALACLYISGYSQHTVTVSVKSREQKKALPSASIIIEKLHKTAVADSSGQAVINDVPPGKYGLLITHVGYKTKELELMFSLADTGAIQVLLEADEEDLSEVVVHTTRVEVKYTDVVTRVETLAKEELDEKGTMKPGDIRMLLNESTGIATQQTSAVSNNAGLRMQGLEDRYTQLLQDGMPLYGGYSGSLSIMQIPPLNLKQVEFIKGPASTLYGGGAIAGLVNLVTKTPGADRDLQFLLNSNSTKGFDATGFYSQRRAKIGLSFYEGYSYNGAYAPANTVFTAIPKTQRVVVNPKLFLYFSRKTTAWFGVNATFENRLGGDIQAINNNADSLHRYIEKNITTRVSTQFSLTHNIDSAQSINIKNALSFFDRSISLADGVFKGRELATFSEVNYLVKKRYADWIAGINEYTEKFTPRYPTTLSYNSVTVGAFIQNTFRPVKWFSAESGLRADYNTPATADKLKGFFVLPRVNLLFKLGNGLSSRVGWGMGYKAPMPFIDDAERINYQGINSFNNGQLLSEKSNGFDADINYKKRVGKIGVTINQLFFYTKVQHPVELQNGYYANIAGYVDTKGAETNVRLSLDELTLYLGYTYTDAKQHFNGVDTWLPLAPKNRVNADVTYEVEGSFRFGVEGFYTGRQALTDGTLGKDYVTFGVLVQKMWQRFSVFVNVENLTDRRQTRWGSIYTGTTAHPVFKDIYAPLDGRVINCGVKIRL